MEKKNNNLLNYVKYGFWAMVALFVVRMILSFFQTPTMMYIGYAFEALFYISVFFVFVNAVRYLAPADKSFAVMALIVSGFFILFIIVMIVAVLLTSASASIGTGTAGLI